MKKLSKDFYQSIDVLLVAKELLGKILVTRFGGMETTGKIVEVEAYTGVADRASHSFGGRRTRRNEVMYAEGGTAYVYFCYGIHHLFNVVTNVKEVPQAVLVRALEPLSGIKHMLARTGKIKPDNSITKGPGNLSKAMGLHTSHSGLSLQSRELFIAEDRFSSLANEMISSPRIGVDYAGEDAMLPYRFYLKDNAYVSGKKYQSF
ncbi:MAG: DNA-3-methyladenine glycosylase [Chitinophagaceae bacterium]|nr:DNA-3-methyladenine glycosylase [Chitinophagaceae bacterium]MBK8951408.1 DNA-3-methyladenine glycosylase [Chitinophagaceae bacterium]